MSTRSRAAVKSNAPQTHLQSENVHTIFSTASRGGGSRSKQPAGYVDLTAEHKQDLGAQGNKDVWICYKCKVYVIDIVVS